MITYPLASNTWDEYEYAAIQSVIDSKMFTMGKKVELYEKNFADLFGSKYAVMVSSGSTANLLMIAALFFTNKPKLKRGDEIIVPAVSWSTTYYPLQQYGLKVKFVDINKETLNIDIDSLKNAISDKTKAILTVNLLGNPNDFAKINEVINNRDIILLEDNCESMGAVFQNKQAGTFGVMGTFSSFYSHHIATMEGGCVVTDDEELYHVLLCLRAHGWTRNLPKENMVTGTKSDDIFEESFKFVLPGYNVRPLEMSGAIGIEQLKKLPGFISTRRSNAQYFVDKFKDHPFLDIQKEVGESSWFGFSFVIKEGAAIERKSLVNNLISAGIECRPIVTGNFLKNERVLSYFDYSVHDTVANAEYIDKNGFFVGNHQIPLFNEIDYLRKVLK
ncbi:DegT/DnrJ/EryC1/StrS family aminotransferase [Escherichia coli]|uniref:Pyridoxamine 5-phosphate-dependent dehydrase n=3 Tax=Escherichia coli TaxID=562 RepID=J3RS50_ECOLX|nr:DegT/DnrJ/EryC1/StrS family aminotransferase [Escherichia coli]EEC7202724.1 DegT/DnrJ/EryC1/StrS family aminotransferase [Escherichia coli O11]EFA8196336.1 DegT/DnrJ/EryC1/StrS family aminotransferase [Escherichia coli O111]EFP9267273.1 DegT/DnrJ/EryC1/StrS family aminotransferase [Shigella flexneri]EFW7517671.1 DegT/DnrJ/EryC1/StrS family aminotransferase [Shigella sonnei]EGW71063.1 degT/DnrJ/EryC1/StrS aminotransferase family protein [Escherichia coli 2534-86]EGW87027.1 degT/DnrJ/EryC1/S